MAPARAAAADAAAAALGRAPMALRPRLALSRSSSQLAAVALREGAPMGPSCGLGHGQL